MQTAFATGRMRPLYSPTELNVRYDPIWPSEPCEYFRVNF
jgi:hypothetical protein